MCICFATEKHLYHVILVHSGSLPDFHKVKISQHKSIHNFPYKSRERITVMAANMNKII